MVTDANGLFIEDSSSFFDWWGCSLIMLCVWAIYEVSVKRAYLPPHGTVRIVLGVILLATIIYGFYSMADTRKNQRLLLSNPELFQCRS